MHHCCGKEGTVCPGCHCNPCTCGKTCPTSHGMDDKMKEGHIRWSETMINVRKKMLTAMNTDDDDKRDGLLKEALQEEIDFYQKFIDCMKNNAC